MLGRLKKAGVWALAVSMAVSMTPASAFADETGGASDPADQVVQVADEGEAVEGVAPVASGQSEAAVKKDKKDAAAEDAQAKKEEKQKKEEAKKDEKTGGEASTLKVKDLDEDFAIDYDAPYVLGEFEQGSFRVYDGTNNWGNGKTAPELAQVAEPKLAEDTDFVREYAFFKNSYTIRSDIFGEKKEKKVEKKTVKKPEKDVNAAAEEAVSSAEEVSAAEVSAADEETPTVTFVSKDVASGWTDPGYIVERISGKGDYEEMDPIYVLHFIAVNYTVQVDDAYKIARGSDPSYYTVTDKVGDHPSDIKTLTPLPFGLLVTVNKAPSTTGPAVDPSVGPSVGPGSGSSVEKAGDEVTLVPMIEDEDELEDRLGMEILYWRVTRGGHSTYHLLSGSGRIAQIAIPVDENQNPVDIRTVSVPPIDLELLPGTLHIEDHSILPASQSRVAKQLEATNLTQSNGKYTTDVKMTLPVTDKETLETFKERMDALYAYFEDQSGWIIRNSDEDTDVDAQGRIPLNLHYTNFAPKQHERISTNINAVFELSSDLALKTDATGKLDLDSLKLMEYLYEAQEAASDDLLTGEGDGDIASLIYNTEPKQGADGFWKLDYKGYRLDCSDLNSEKYYFLAYLPDDAEVIGFGRMRFAKEETDGEAEPTVDPMGFRYWAIYLPGGIESIKVPENAVGESSYSEIDGPVLMISSNDMVKMPIINPTSWANSLNPGHYLTFQFSEELKSPDTAAGTHGSYDQYGKNGLADIKVLDSAFLQYYDQTDNFFLRRGVLQSESDEVNANASAVRVPSGAMMAMMPQKPEAFYIPTVSYTVGNGGGNGGGGGRTSGGLTAITEPQVPLAEPEVPLAELPELNKTDHVAYVEGYEDGTVRPENYITRAEVATIFFRLLTEDSRNAIRSTSNGFTDTTATAWYNEAVSTLSKGGVLAGYADGTFLPGGNITRAEFATIAARFDQSAVDTSKVSFTDISGHWAESNIKKAAALGYITGYEDGSFNPNAPITRAEAMTLLNRVLGRDKITAAGLLDNMKKFSDNPATAWYYVAVQEATNSHDYTIENGVEKWTSILPDRDWSALEKAWATGAEAFTAPEAETQQPAAEEPAAEAEAEAEAQA